MNNKSSLQFVVSNFEPKQYKKKHPFLVQTKVKGLLRNICSYLSKNDKLCEVYLFDAINGLVSFTNCMNVKKRLSVKTKTC